jgi:hypothetical protein
MSVTLTKRIASSEDCHGFNGAFSWWRNSLDYRFWIVCGHSKFTVHGIAVTDDFGTLVSV